MFISTKIEVKGIMHTKSFGNLINIHIREDGILTSGF